MPVKCSHFVSVTPGTEISPKIFYMTGSLKPLPLWLKAWLSRIMVNTALEAIRKQTQHIELDIETAPEIADPEYEDDDKIVKNIPQETLLRFISELPDGYRTVFNLFTFENKSHKEIANLLHINEKSSSSQLHRARTILMNRVKQYWAQYENG